jgi:hypothetical protein
MADVFKSYRKKQLAEMRPYVVGEPMTSIAVNDVDRAAGSPQAGDLIARNPANHADQWLVSAAFVAANYEPA